MRTKTCTSRLAQDGNFHQEQVPHNRIHSLDHWPSLGCHVGIEAVASNSRLLEEELGLTKLLILSIGLEPKLLHEERGQEDSELFRCLARTIGGHANRSRSCRGISDGGDW